MGVLEGCGGVTPQVEVSTPSPRPTLVAIEVETPPISDDLDAPGGARDCATRPGLCFEQGVAAYTAAIRLPRPTRHPEELRAALELIERGCETHGRSDAFLQHDEPLLRQPAPPTCAELIGEARRSGKVELGPHRLPCIPDASDDLTAFIMTTKTPYAGCLRRVERRVLSVVTEPPAEPAATPAGDLSIDLRESELELGEQLLQQESRLLRCYALSEGDAAPSMHATLTVKVDKLGFLHDVALAGSMDREVTQCVEAVVWQFRFETTRSRSTSASLRLRP